MHIRGFPAGFFMSVKKGRFSCYIDLSKPGKAAQAYYFLKGLGNLRQDILIDMVLRTLGEDINLDLEHMSRAELLALYNKNVYGKGAFFKEAPATFPKPDEELFHPDAVEPKEQAKPASLSPAEGTRTENLPLKDEGTQTRTEAEITWSESEPTTEIETEKPFPLEQDRPQREKPVGLQIHSLRRQQAQAAENQRSEPIQMTQENDPDDLDLLPDDNTDLVTDMIGDSFRDA